MNMEKDDKESAVRWEGGMYWRKFDMEHIGK